VSPARPPEGAQLPPGGTARGAKGAPINPAGLRTALLHYSASSGLSLLVRMAVGLLLARWLSPQAFGTWGLALAIYGGCQLLRDLGVSAWVQRAPALDGRDWSAVLGLSLSAALACALGLWVLAPALEAALAHAGLAAPLRLLALAVPLSALGSLLAALQMRELAARPLAWVARAGDLTHAVLALGLCISGWGATGLAAAELGCGLVCTALSWRLRERGLRWRPGLRGWGRLLRFGLPLQGAQALAWATAAWPAAWLGLRLPGGELGHFLRAQATAQLLPQLAQPALGFAALPWLPPGGGPAAGS
jgi:O-antigen/teichoic acid export membrane protein